MDLLTLDAVGLQSLLEQHKITSIELVKQVLAQIKREDQNGAMLNAMIALAPEQLLMSKAAQLDEERRAGKVRSRLHGIPILIKDAISTHPDLGMGTTVGSYALMHSKPRKSATVVQQLVESGLLVVGKTNLNELCNYKGSRTTNGWSAVGDQTQSAYILGGILPEDGPMGHSNPCGSSTGSAVGVSAGFSPLSLGTETEGSLIQPATRAALYAMKPTVNTVSTVGVWATSKRLDTVGAMAKSVRDLANVMEIMVIPAIREKLPSDGFGSWLTKSFEGLTIGFLSPTEWHFSPDKCRPVESATLQMDRAYEAAIGKIQEKGAKTVYSISIPPVSELRILEQSTSSIIINHDYKDAIGQYLSGMESSDVRSLDDIIEFNKAHAELALPEKYPDQAKLINASQYPPTDELYERAIQHMTEVARTKGLDLAFESNGLDLLAVPMDSPIASMAAASGYPIGTMPLGLLDYNGRPFGLGVMAKPSEEGLIFKFMSAFEAEFPERRVPPALCANNSFFKKWLPSNM